tara:strand:- start:1961 stop:3226 length:1266 start_codon:yes stop_codon:yes gene_type:complete
MKIQIKRPKLTSYQIAFLYNPSRFTVTEASTKVGKTFSHIWWIYEQAHADWNQENYNHWWVAPVYAQAEIAFKRMKAKVSRTGLYKINESKLIITTPIGTHIHFKSAEKPDNLFGEDVYSCVFDEAPRARKEAFYALRSTLTATRGKMKIIGNFGGAANWVHHLKDKAATDSEYAYFKITAWDAVKEGILEEAEVLQAKKDLPEKIFNQLYLAEVTDVEEQIYSYESICNLFTNSSVKGNGQRYMSGDIAYLGADLFVISIWEGFKIEKVIAIDKIDETLIGNKLIELAKEYRIPYSNIVYDADGLRKFTANSLKALTASKPFVNNSLPLKDKNFGNLKSECAYKLRELMLNNLIYCEDQTFRSQIVSELESIRLAEPDPEAKIKLERKKYHKERTGKSPDFFDSLLMRMVFELKKSGGWV